MSDDTIPSGCGVVIFIVGGIIGFVIMYYADNESWKKDSVKHNTGEFYLDEKHERQWRWKP